MNAIKTSVAKVKNNPIGAIAGGAVAFYAMKKMTKVRSPWMLGGAAVVGVIAGAMIQSAIKGKAGAPTKDDVTSDFIGRRKLKMRGRAQGSVIERCRNAGGSSYYLGKCKDKAGNEIDLKF